VKNSTASAKDVYVTGMEHITQQWKSVLIMKEPLWINSINFVTDKPEKHINFKSNVCGSVHLGNMFYSNPTGCTIFFFLEEFVTGLTSE
jgi:hypothetical protein